MSLSDWDGNPAIWSVNIVDAAIHGKTSNGGQLHFDREPGGRWNVDPDISDHIAKEGVVFSIDE